MGKDKENKKLPDFLIVGAAKCGTTSLAKYLEAHQNIFICPNKEPKFLTYDTLKDKYKGPGDAKKTKASVVKTLEEYYNIFLNAEANQIVGEASVDSIYYYKEVIPRIKELMGDPHIIIMLRNPVNRAVSAYSHLIRDQRETLTFENALLVEEERLSKGYEYIWGYVNASYYYESVKAYKEAFTNVKVIIFEEFVQNVKTDVFDVLNFLNIDSIHHFSEEHFNASGKPKNKWINKFLISNAKYKQSLKKIIGEKRAISIKNKIQKKNLEKIVIDKETEFELFKKFKYDIENLEHLLNRDLSIWKIYQEKL